MDAITEAIKAAVREVIDERISALADTGQSRLMAVENAARYLDCSPNYLRGLIKIERLSYVKLDEDSPSRQKLFLDRRDLMRRISYCEEESYPGQFALWQANCLRSLHGKRGQEELRMLKDALLSLPDKRLISDLLVDDEGEVCAVGAYAKHKGHDLQAFDPEESTDEVGFLAGMPSLVAWKVVQMNDMEFSHLTPERRYVKMLEWIELQLAPVGQK